MSNLLDETIPKKCVYLTTSCLASATPQPQISDSVKNRSTLQPWYIKLLYLSIILVTLEGK